MCARCRALDETEVTRFKTEVTLGAQRLADQALDKRHSAPISPGKAAPVVAKVKAKPVVAKKSAARGERLRPDWEPPESFWEWCQGEQIPIVYVKGTILPTFRDFWAGKAGASGAKLDWTATLRNWVRKDWRDQSHSRAASRSGAVDYTQVDYGTEDEL